MKRRSQAKAVLREYASSVATYAIGFLAIRLVAGLLPLPAGRESWGPLWVPAAFGAFIGLAEGTGRLIWNRVRFGRFAGRCGY